MEVEFELSKATKISDQKSTNHRRRLLKNEQPVSSESSRRNAASTGCYLFKNSAPYKRFSIVQRAHLTRGQCPLRLTKFQHRPLLSERLKPDFCGPRPITRLSQKHRLLIQRTIGE